jgi:hypothetical protein
MKQLLTTLALIAGLLLGGATLAPSAGASSWDVQRGEHAKCVTSDETRAITGMTRADAEKILDGPGYAGPLYDGARDYRPCGLAWEHGRVTVRYGKAGRVWFATKLVFRGGELALPIGHPRA